MTGRGLKDERSAAVFFFEGYLGVSPSVAEAIRHLDHAGFRVVALCRAPDGEFGAPPALPPTVALHVLAPLSRYLPSSTRFPRIVAKVVRGLGLVLDVAQFTFESLRSSRGRDYDVAIGIDMYGLIAAWAAARVATVRHLVYWSLEIRYARELSNPIARLAKVLETRIAPTVDFSVVQDEVRAMRLREASRVTDVVIVPNSPSGLPGDVDPTFLHHRLGIAHDVRIVLHAGWISEDLLASDLAKAASRWPDGYVLVLHERERRSPADPYLRRLVDLGHGRVVLSLEPLPLDLLDNVFASAFVGVALYATDRGPNLSDIGAASGKLGYYLRNGVPVVVNSLPSLAHFVTESGCGIVVESVEQIGEAIDTIALDRAAFSLRSRSVFTEHLEFGQAFDRAFSVILGTRPQSSPT